MSIESRESSAGVNILSGAIPGAILIVSVLAIAGCGGSPVRGRVERAVERRLPEMIGPASRYSVTAHGPVTRMTKGKLNRLDITGEDVVLASGIAISRLEVSITDLEFDTSSNTIRRAGATRYTAVLSEAEVNRWARSRYPDVPDLNVSLRDGSIRVSARPGMSKARVTVQADARPVIRDQRTLALDLSDVRAIGVSAPGFAREYLESRLPVIFDVRDLGFDARISSVEITPGALKLQGELDLLAAAQAR